MPKNSRTRRKKKEEDRDPDYYPEHLSPVPVGEDEETVFRPPLQGVRKRLSGGPMHRGAANMDTADYRRITEMITELVDMRARMEEVYKKRDGNNKRLPATPSIVRLDAQVPIAAADTEVTGVTAGKRKKKKKKTEGSSAGVDPSRSSEDAKRPKQNRNIEVGSSSQLNSTGRRGSVSKPLAQDRRETWSTVVRKGRGTSGRPAVSAETPVQRRKMLLQRSDLVLPMLLDRGRGRPLWVEQPGKFLRWLR